MYLGSQNGHKVALCTPISRDPLSPPFPPAFLSFSAITPVWDIIRLKNKTIFLWFGLPPPAEAELGEQPRILDWYGLVKRRRCIWQMFIPHCCPHRSLQGASYTQFSLARVLVPDSYGYCCRSKTSRTRPAFKKYKASPWNGVGHSSEKSPLPWQFSMGQNDTTV